MKKMLHGLVLTMALLFIHACGGGGGSSSTSDSLFIANPSKDIKKIDISDKEKTLLTKENILELLKMSTSYIPTDLEFSRSEYDVLLSKSDKKTQKCSDGGFITLVTDAKNSKLAFGFDNCKIEGITSNGAINIEFKERTDNGEVGFYRGKDLTFTDGTNTYIYNYNIKFNNRDYNDGTKEYYIDVYHLEKDEQTKINMTIQSFAEDTNITGTYLLNNNTYFTLESKDLKNLYLPILSIRDNQLFDDFFDTFNDNGEILLHGRNSEFIYRIIDYKNFYSIEDKNVTFYSIEDNDWTEDIYTLFSNDFAPYIGIVVKKSFVRDSEIYIVLDENQTFELIINDSDRFGRYSAYIKCLKKPQGSQLLDRVEIPLSKSQQVSHINLDTFRTISFDKEGLYVFEVEVHDGEKIAKKTFSFEYYKNVSIEKNRLDGEFSEDILFEPSTKSLLLLDEKNSELVIIDNSFSKVVVPLPLQPSNMTLIPNTTYVAISSDAKIFVVDIQTETIIKEYIVPDSMGDLVVFSHYIYTLKNTDNWSNLYSINMDTSDVGTLKMASYGKGRIIVNPEQKSLYIMNNGVSPGDIDKFDISDGNASELYDSPYHGDYNFGYTLWYISSSKLLTSSGITLSMNNTKSLDMIYQGSSEIARLEKSKYGWVKESIIKYEESKDKSRYLILSSDTDSTKGSYSLISRNHIANQLSIYTNKSKVPVFNQTIIKYYQNEFGEKYRCYIQNGLFLDNNRVFILYEAWNDDSRGKFNFYQIIDIP